MIIPTKKNKFISLTRRQSNFFSLKRADIAEWQSARKAQLFIAKPAQLFFSMAVMPFFLSLCCTNNSQSPPYEIVAHSNHPKYQHIAEELLQTIYPERTEVSKWLSINENYKNTFDHFFKETIYHTLATLLKSSSHLAHLGSAICQISPWASQQINELFLFSQLCASIGEYLFKQTLKESDGSMSSLPTSQLSWHINKALLSKIPVHSSQDFELVRFLQERWLAKVAGFFPLVIDWIYPCFKINVQIHPTTSHCYARLLTSALPAAYKNRMQAWKKALPHPDYFPLILTRLGDVRKYLPISYKLFQQDDIDRVAKQLSMQTSAHPLLLDATDFFLENPEQYHSIWQSFSELFIKVCKKYNIDSKQILCIQRITQETIGGLRLLALPNQTPKILEQHHQMLLDWISCFGLAANRVELDRWSVTPSASDYKRSKVAVEKKSLKKEFTSLLHEIDLRVMQDAPHKMILLEGTFQIFKGLLHHISEDKWSQVANHPTQAMITELAILKIKKELKSLLQKESHMSFFEFASHLELIHADFSSLLEMFSPFVLNDFSAIYRDLLSIPLSLKPLTSYAVHSSAMTSLAGILQATEISLKRKPFVLYGENTYFECVKAIQKMSTASLINTATEEDYKQVDLVLAQFNPALRLDGHPTYRIENIAEVLHKCLHHRESPLVLALDSTIDFIDSPLTTQLLKEFQEEIKNGALNIISFRSGNKFDLLGMDNYCGAPLFMIHNQDPKWDCFGSLLLDPVLLTDRLSLNWFCLAYQYAAPQLELYRKQIFDNTRALLNKVPPRLLQAQGTDYRVVPFEEDAKAGFIDIKVSGPFHTARSSALVAGSLYLKALEKKHPVFHRPSLGFYHPNFIMIFNEKSSTLRLTLGLDPDQIDLFAQCLERIDQLSNYE